MATIMRSVLLALVLALPIALALPKAAEAAGDDRPHRPPPPHHPHPHPHHHHHHHHPHHHHYHHYHHHHHHEIPPHDHEVVVPPSTRLLQASNSTDVFLKICSSSNSDTACQGDLCRQLPARIPELMKIIMDDLPHLDIETLIPPNSDSVCVVMSN